MVVETRFFVVGIFLMIGMFLGVFGAFPFRDALISSAEGIGMHGTVIESTALETEVVRVEKNTREEVRASLRERLAMYAREQKESDVATLTMVQNEVPRNTGLATSTPEGCPPQRTDTPLPSWGVLSVRVVEGARVITSAAIDDGGALLHVLELPLEPQETEKETCVQGAMSGILFDGTIVMPGIPVTTDAEGIAGYALDGFPIYSSYEDGKEIRSTDLDTCHGHAHAIVDRGETKVLYHYHITEDAPYSTSCFRGSPVTP